MWSPRTLAAWPSDVGRSALAASWEGRRVGRRDHAGFARRRRGCDHAVMDDLLEMPTDWDTLSGDRAAPRRHGVRRLRSSRCVDGRRQVRGLPAADARRGRHRRTGPRGGGSVARAPNSGGRRATPSASSRSSSSTSPTARSSTASRCDERWRRRSAGTALELVVTVNHRDTYPGGGFNMADHRVTGLAVLDAVRDAANRWVFTDLAADGAASRGIGVRWVATSRLAAGHARCRHHRAFDRGVARWPPTALPRQPRRQPMADQRAICSCATMAANRRSAARFGGRLATTFGGDE